MNGWCSQRKCTLVEAKNQCILYSTFYNEAMVYPNVKIEENKKGHILQNKDHVGIMCHWEQTGHTFLQCRYFHLMWIVYNCSHSLHNSKQNQLLIYFFRIFLFRYLTTLNLKHLFSFLEKN